MPTFYNGFVYELDVAGERLIVEGVPVDDSDPTLSRDDVAERYIDSVLAPGRDRRRQKYLAVLNKGADVWNAWRRRHPFVCPTLAYAQPGEITRSDLRRCDFSYTNLSGAYLRGLDLRHASFHQAILAQADLREADLKWANFCRTDLFETDLTDAHLEYANLQGVQLARTKLAGAHLSHCTIYGLAAWDLSDVPADQAHLKIRYTSFTGDPSEQEEQSVEVDGLDLASFMYLTLNNRNIARIIDAAGSSWVLILGRFTGPRQIIDTVKATVTGKGGIPIVFDFPPPERRDLIETLLLLAGLSAFVVVDLTNPRSTPLEAQAIAPNFGVPLLPLIQGERKIPAMFAGLKKYPWVHAPIRYDTPQHLATQLGAWIDMHRAQEDARLKNWDAAASGAGVSGDSG